MTKGELGEKIKQSITTGEGWCDKSAHLPMKDIADVLESIGMSEEDFESNGWAWDWAMNLSFDGKRYALYGSGYDGGLNFEAIE